MSTSEASKTRPKLLLIYIHGFKGTNETFEHFPRQLASILRAKTDGRISVESIVYPSFETKGVFRLALENLEAWSLEKTRAALEKGHARVNVVFLGHSMGGLLAADVHQHFKKAAYDRIHSLGTVAYDTPYLGLYPNLFSRTAMDRAGKITRTLGKALTTQLPKGISLSRDGQGNAHMPMRWAVITATAVTAVALTAGVVARSRIQAGVTYISDHLEYVGALVREQEILQRMMDAPNDLFHCFYTMLDLDPRNIADRTFILPPTTEEMASVLEAYPSTHSPVQASRRVEDFFTAVPIDASDEVEAHISMFNPNLNASYDDMLEDTAWLVSERLSSLCQGF